MQRSELVHVLRASAAIANETSFVLIGSQAILLLLDTLLERISLLDPTKHDLAHITQWTQRRAQEATP